MAPSRLGMGVKKRTTKIVCHEHPGKLPSPKHKFPLSPPKTMGGEETRETFTIRKVTVNHVKVDKVVQSK